MTGKRRNEAEEDDNENEERSLRYFNPVYVFDVRQTKGDDLPSPNQRLNATLSPDSVLAGPSVLWLKVEDD